jgi:hypothetical protein
MIYKDTRRQHAYHAACMVHLHEYLFLFVECITSSSYVYIYICRKSHCTTEHYGMPYSYGSITECLNQSPSL